MPHILIGTIKMGFEEHPNLGNKHTRGNFALPRVVEGKKVSSSQYISPSNIEKGR
jgi:hypothetical protein